MVANNLSATVTETCGRSGDDSDSYSAGDRLIIIAQSAGPYPINAKLPVDMAVMSAVSHRFLQKKSQ
jgi:hypothetical protein